MTYEETKHGIGWAVCMIKAGGSVRRAGWPEGTRVFLAMGHDKKGRETGVRISVMERRVTDGPVRVATIKAWTATSDDLLATDWEAYESEGD